MYFRDYIKINKYISTLYEKYIASVFTYSGIRKLIYTYDIKYRQKIDNKIEEHRVIHFLFAGLMGIGLAPMHFVNDLERLERYQAISKALQDFL